MSCKLFATACRAHTACLNGVRTVAQCTYRCWAVPLPTCWLLLFRLGCGYSWRIFARRQLTRPTHLLHFAFCLSAYSHLFKQPYKSLTMHLVKGNNNESQTAGGVRLSPHVQVTKLGLTRLSRTGRLPLYNCLR